MPPTKAIVKGLPLGRATRILDLCGGTGAVGQLLLAAAPKASLYEIDLDPVQIGLAAQNYAKLGYPVRQIDAPDLGYAPASRSVTLQVGSATDLPFSAGTFDFVNIANAIHLIGAKEDLVGAISRVLRSGGMFAFSTGYYAGCWPPLTQQVYYEWTKEAIAWIARRSAAQVAAGGPGIKRQRVKSQLSTVAYQNRWLTLDEWRTLLSDNGLDVQHLAERPVLFDRHSLAAIGSYSGLARGAAQRLSGRDRIAGARRHRRRSPRRRRRLQRPAQLARGLRDQAQRLNATAATEPEALSLGEFNHVRPIHRHQDVHPGRA